MVNDAMDLSFTTNLKYLFMLMKTWFREVLYYWLHHEFLSTFKIAAFSFFKFYRQAKNWENMQKKIHQVKYPKKFEIIFGYFFGPKMRTLQMIHVLMYWQKSVRF